MQDTHVTVQELKLLAQKFVEERDWGQFHNPKNLSIGIALEAAELMEQFQWCSTEASYDECLKYNEAVRHELADMATYISSKNACAEIQHLLIKNSPTQPAPLPAQRFIMPLAPKALQSLKF